MKNNLTGSLLALTFIIFVAGGCGLLKKNEVSNANFNSEANGFKSNTTTTSTPSEKMPSGKAIAWNLANKLSIAAILHSKDVEASDSLANAKILAEEVGAVIPPFPVNTGDKIKDTVAVMDYLLNDVNKNVGGSVRAKYGQKEADLFDMALKTSTLLLIYGPGEKEGKAVTNVIRRDAKSAELPENLWMPVVSKIESDSSFDEVKNAILEMQTNVSQYLQKS